MTRDRDAVDRILDEWRAVRGDVDPDPIAVIGRISRLSRLIDKHLAEHFATHGLEAWMYDVMATLRRIGPPHELTAGDLVRRTMVTTGAITNRIDRLEALGYVQRLHDPADRRKVIVRLTSAGIAKVDDVVDGHLATERALLDVLGGQRQATLARQLKVLLLQLGDDDPGSAGDA